MPRRTPQSLCVVGAGQWGKNHIRALSELGILGGIVDTDAEIRAERGTQYPGAKCFADVAAAAEQDFDGFVVATPAHTHRAVAEQLLRAGKHVLVEKPIALTAADAKVLVDLARERNLKLMVGHVLLFHPAIRKIRELIDTGKIGKLQYVYSNRLNLGTVRTEENILWSFAPHDVSIFDYLVGSEPEEVVSRGGAFLQPGIHDSTMTLLRYPDNVIGHIFVSWLHPFKEHRIVVVGSKGMLSFDDAATEKPLLFYEKGIDWVRGEPTKRDGATEQVEYDSTPPLTAELQYFSECIAGKPVEVSSGASGLAVLSVLERASDSLLGKAPDPAEPTGDFFVHPSAYVDDNVAIGTGTKIWHFSHIQPGARIGEKCSLGQNVNVANNVTIGNHVKIQNNVSVYEGVTLEDYVFCGPSMVFTNVNEPRSKYPQRGSEHYAKTLVKTGASLGANCTIVCGHTVGCHAFVAAGAVVTKDVPDYALVAGVPAKQLGWVCECGKRLEVSGREATCGCGIAYRVDGGALRPR